MMDLLGIKVLRPLNYVPYVKQEAMQLLIDRFGWQPYPQKHFESRFTRFYESYWLPTRFGYDVRRVQYSSLILTKQMTRSQAAPLEPETRSKPIGMVQSSVQSLLPGLPLHPPVPTLPLHKAAPTFVLPKPTEPGLPLSRVPQIGPAQDQAPAE